MKRKGKRICVYLAVAVMVLTVSSLMLPATSFAQGSGPADSPWPMFRHDLQHTGLSPYSGPQDPTELWRYGTGDQIHSSLAIGADGSIYFGSLDNYFYALDSDGYQKWRFKTKGQVYSSPAIGADGTIYVGCNDQWFYAINPDGTQKWKFATGDYIQTSPAIGPDGTIYVGSTDDTLYAFDPDGALKWSYEMEGNILSSAAIAPDGTIYVGCDSQYLYAFKSDGTVKWKYGTHYGLDSSPAIGPDGTIYFGTDYGDFHAVNPNGTVKWRYPESAQLGSSIYSSPAIAEDGTIYFGCYDDTFYALEPDGSLKWKYEASDSFKSSPAIGADGTVYVGCLDDYLYAFEPDGNRKWRYKTGAIHSSPAIGAEGIIYVGSADHHLYALGEGYEPQSPMPSFEFSPDNPQAGMQLVFDASASRDPDGSIEKYAWDFGDGQTGSGEVVTHAYDEVGGYIATLSVTDNDGLPALTTAALTVGKSLLPIASLEFWPEVPATGEKVAFDASASNDPDGNIEKYEWDFGDEQTASGALVTHTYGAPGDYNVTLTLTDNNGFVGEKTAVLTVSEIMFPIASFEFLPKEPQIGVEVTFDSSASEDPDGNIEEYEWDFGDGQTGSGETTSHAYETGGGFNVILTVTDNDDFKKSITEVITVGESNLPVASFEFWPQEPAGGEKVAFDASDSQIPDGAIEAYQWNFGDGQTGSGQLVSHVYQEPGEYQVTLTLTDDSGDKTSEVMSVMVASLEGDDSGDSGIPFWVWIIIAGAVIAAGYSAFYWRQKKSAVQQDPE